MGPGLVEPGSRHQAREQALSLLYEADRKGLAPSKVLAGLAVQPGDYARRLLKGVEATREEADRLISDAAVGWPLERLAVMDRLVLRLAIAELLDPDGPPVPVVLDEAVELAKTYSTEESGRFVNGILSTVARQLH